MKKPLSLILALCLLVTLMPSACYAFEECSDKVASTTSSFEELTEEEIYEQMLRQLPSDERQLIALGLLSPENQCVTHNSRAVTLGPYSNANLPSAAAFIMVNALQNKSFSEVTYSGKICYKFVYGSDTAYVEKAVFQQENKYGIYPTNDMISSNITSYLNRQSSDYYYSARHQIFMADGVPHANFTLYGIAAKEIAPEELVVQTKVIASVTSYSNFAVVKKEVSPGMYVNPNIGIAITNVGANSAFMNGYYVKANGSSSSTTDISDLINLGYKVSAAAGSVTGLTYKTYYEILHIAVSFTEGTPGYYESPLVFLSNTSTNPSESRYIYSCEMRSPVKLSNLSSYYEMHTYIHGGVYGASYKVTISL